MPTTDEKKKSDEEVEHERSLERGQWETAI